MGIPNASGDGTVRLQLFKVSCAVTIAFGEEDNQVSLVAIIIHSQVTRNGGMFPQISSIQ